MGSEWILCKIGWGCGMDSVDSGLLWTRWQTYEFWRNSIRLEIWILLLSYCYCY
jgi:hypothetical protein